MTTVRGDPGKWLPLSEGSNVRLSGRASEQVGIALQIQRPTLVAGNTVAHALPAVAMAAAGKACATVSPVIKAGRCICSAMSIFSPTRPDRRTLNPSDRGNHLP